MPNLVPYIVFGDKSREAVEFYRTVFGGEADVQVEGGRVVHLEFHSGDLHFMGSDLQGNQPGLERYQSTTLVLNCDSEAQLRDFFDKLVYGGQMVFAPVDGGWGAVVAHCVDQFAVSWMLNFDQPQ